MSYFIRRGPVNSRLSHDELFYVTIWWFRLIDVTDTKYVPHDTPFSCIARTTIYRCGKFQPSPIGQRRHGWRHCAWVMGYRVRKSLGWAGTAQ